MILEKSQHRGNQAKETCPLENRYRFITAILVVGLNGAAFTQENLPPPDITQSIQTLAVQGYFGQAQFFQDVALMWPEALPVLIRNIDHPNEVVREMVIKSLRFNDAACLDVARELGKRLNDSSRKIRYESIYSIRALNCTSEISALEKLIASEEDPRVLNIAISTLGIIGGAAQTLFLRKIENDTARSLETRLHATYALIRLKGDYDSHLIVEGLNGSDERVITVSLRALGRSGNTELHNSLQSKIQSHKVNKRIAAEATYAEKTVTLYAPGKTQADQEHYLFSLIEADDPIVREWAVLTLIEEFNTPHNIERLTNILISESKGKAEVLSTLIYKKIKPQEELLHLIEENMEEQHEGHDHD